MTGVVPFTVSEDVAGDCVWPQSPAVFADVDSASLTVPLGVQFGTLTAEAATGITLEGIPGGLDVNVQRWTLTGTAAAPNTCFQTAGNIQYTTRADGDRSASTTSTIVITAT